jgi:hypothetical protein
MNLEGNFSDLFPKVNEGTEENGEGINSAPNQD